MKLALIVTAISAVIFIGFGTAFLFAPATMSTWVGFTVNTPTGMADVRATYGGCELGVGLFLAFCLVRRTWIDAALMLQVLTLAGFATGRVLGIASDGPQQAITYVAFAMEAGGVAIALVALAMLAREKPAASKSAEEDVIA